MGEKTGWTYITVPSKTAWQINPGKKTSYRVKGKLDELAVSKAALIPFGGGDFILPVNASMRKGLRKRAGDEVVVFLEPDDELEISADLLSCLEDEPVAKSYFTSLPLSHQRYYSRWIESAKTAITKTKRISQAISAFSQKLSYAEMMRMNKDKGR